MHNTLSTKSPSLKNRFGHRLMLATAIGCALLAGSVSAQVVVVDPGSIAANEQSFAAQLAKTIEQYAKQIQQYETQLQQYQQLLSSIQGLSNGLSLAPNKLQRVTNTDSLIQGKCSNTSSPTGLVSGVMNSMSSLMTQSITQTQRMICGQIVATQIHKYNTTVDMLNKLNNYSSQFHQVESIVKSISTVADTGRAATQVEKYNSAVTTEMGNWQAQMKADDAIIETLQNQQSILGHVALNGNSTVLGNVIQASTFAAAFH